MQVSEICGGLDPLSAEANRKKVWARLPGIVPGFLRRETKSGAE